MSTSQLWLQTCFGLVALALCGGTHSKDDDPWSQGDPWQKFRPSSAPAPMPAQPPIPTDSMHPMESRIQAAVMAKLPQATPMEQDDAPEKKVPLKAKCSS